MDADLAVELVKCGADDFLTLPPAPAALLRKVRRATGRISTRPAFDVPALQPLQRKQWKGEDRRLCHRVRVPGNRLVRAHFEESGQSAALSVVDLSIATEARPGGLLLRANADAARLIAVDRRRRGETLSFGLDLVDGGSRISVEARVVRVRPGPARTVLVAVSYMVTDAQAEARLRLLWMDLQRRHGKYGRT